DELRPARARRRRRVPDGRDRGQRHPAGCSMTGTVLIVGAGLAGTRCAETLRAEGYDGRVLLAGEEPHPPYERPALSKELLAGAKQPADLALRPDGHWQEHGIELLLGTRVTTIDARARTATTAGGRTLPWDSLVLATGARARTLPGLAAGVHLLRTLADASALRDELGATRRLAVVGAGFVGGEVATSAQALGVAVTVVEAAAAPLGRVVGALLAARYRARGIDLRLGAGLAGFRRGPEGRLRGVLLADGTEVAC